MCYGEIMANNSDKRKKTLIISMLVFLFTGGGIFLFFIIQGSNDLTGKGKKNTFSYGFAMRDAVTPLFKALGITTYDEEVQAASIKRLEARGLDLSQGNSSPTDISDWMARDKPGASPVPGRSGGAASPAKVPRMGMRALSLGKGGGGTSKSSGSSSRFGAGSESGETSINSNARAAKAGAADKGTLGALKHARASLGEGLQSGSAMTAKNKWDQSFGVSGGKKGGELAYNKSGLVSLDKIKSGQIADLKIGKTGSLKTPDVSNPVKDVEGTKAALDQDKNFKEEMDKKIKEDAVKQAIQAAADAATKDQKKTDEKGGTSDDPPGNVQKMALARTEDGGKLCTGGCEAGDGGKYSDKSVGFERDPDNPDKWIVSYNGEQKMPDGSTIYYSDRMSLDPSTGAFTPLSSVAGDSQTNMKPVAFGGS